MCAVPVGQTLLETAGVKEVRRLFLLTLWDPLLHQAVNTFPTRSKFLVRLKPDSTSGTAAAPNRICLDPQEGRRQGDSQLLEPRGPGWMKQPESTMASFLTDLYTNIIITIPIVEPSTEGFLEVFP